MRGCVGSLERCQEAWKDERMCGKFSGGVGRREDVWEDVKRQGSKKRAFVERCQEAREDERMCGKMSGCVERCQEAREDERMCCEGEAGVR